MGFMQKSPYTITPKILKLVSQIQSLLGETKHLIVKKPSIKLRAMEEWVVCGGRLSKRDGSFRSEVLEYFLG